MRPRTRALTLIVLFLAPLLSATAIAQQRVNSSTTGAAQIPAPAEVLGFTPGDDRKLASWNQVLSYFEKLDRASNRVKFEALGKTTMDVPFVMATISAPENLARLDEYKRIQRLLADPRKLGAPAGRDRKAAALIKRGKTIVLITCGIHSTEVGSYLSSMLLAHQLASSNRPEILGILKNTIILLVPSLNPDGVDIVKNWYDKTLGTPYEGTSPPELYHKYVGHDNNRDWYAFTQVETQITVDKIHNVWHPQIVHDIHQQGEYGARLFLPPYMTPVEPNVPKQIVEGYTELGGFIARELRAKGFAAITTNSTYDAWTPARAYSHYHGGVRILSETASARIASPITLKFDQLRGQEGYDAKKESANFNPLWRGGEWHLRDITNYMTTAAFTLLSHASANRERWLRKFYEIGKDAVRPRRRGELLAYLFPGKSYAHQTLYVDRASGEIRSRSNELGDSTQKEAEFNRERLLGILRRGGVEINQVTRVRANGIALSEHPMMVRLDQPYGSFAKTLLESQSYPNLRDTHGHPQQPYDVTAHSLPLLMGVKVIPVDAPLQYLQDVQYMGFAVDGEEEQRTRLGVYKSHVPAMDEGWTRWTLEHVPLELTPRKFPMIRSFGFESLLDGELRAGQLYPRYEQIIIPDQNPATILNGHKAGTMPPEYTGGLGEAGVKALREFVEQGGTLVCLNRASSFAIEQFKLPVRNVVAGVPEKEFFVPGSILEIELDTSHPIARGMPAKSIAWVEESPVFEVIDRSTGVRVIARYPTDKNPLLSGWLLGDKRIRGKAALVEVSIGKGKIILFGFRPQYRAQSLATYPLLFNAISAH